MRRTWSWTAKQRDKLEKVKKVLEEFRQYWPLTLRQVYYQLVAKQFIENKVTEYGMLSRLLKYARLEELVPWAAIEDRLRVSTLNSGWNDKNHFVESSIRYFLDGYRRHLQQEQENYVEIWIEKDALSSIFQRVTGPYCIPVCVCRGFSSISFLHELRGRLSNAQEDKQEPVILYFGDLDPSGEEMLPAMEETLREEMGMMGVEYKKVALTKADIEEYNLPHDPNAVKKTDSRYEKFVEKYGLYAVELDALPPNILEGKIQEAIEAHVDMTLFGAQQDVETNERTQIKVLKTRVTEWMREHRWD